MSHEPWSRVLRDLLYLVIAAVLFVAITATSVDARHHPRPTLSEPGVTVCPPARVCEAKPELTLPPTDTAR